MGLLKIWTGSEWKQVSISDASDISNTPAGDIEATTVQTAIDELDTEKLALAGGIMTGAVIAPDFIRNTTRTYTYNANGLVETMTVTGGLTTTYSYDANDLITSFTDTVRTWTPTYDGDDNITVITVT